MRAVYGFFILVLAFQVGFAYGDTYTQLEAMEEKLAEAYNGHDNDNFERLFKALITEYQKLKMPQEEAWTHLRYGNLAKALQLEDQLALNLKANEALTTRPIGAKVTVTELVLADDVSGVYRIADPRTVRADVLMYEISRVLGDGLVPVTVPREYLGMLGSLQIFLKQIYPGDQGFIISPYRHEKLHILDFLTHFKDRHRNNWCTVPGGHIVAIDNNAVIDTPIWLRLKDDAHHPRSSQLPPRSISLGSQRAVERLKRELDNPTSRVAMAASPEQRSFILKRIEILLQLSRDKGCKAGLQQEVPLPIAR